MAKPLDKGIGSGGKGNSVKNTGFVEFTAARDRLGRLNWTQTWFTGARKNDGKIHTYRVAKADDRLTEERVKRAFFEKDLRAKPGYRGDYDHIFRENKKSKYRKAPGHASGKNPETSIPQADIEKALKTGKLKGVYKRTPFPKR